MKKRGLKRFYTLIEIMTVIVIAAILFGIGIPAFTTMIQGSNMTVAIRQLSAKISAARAYAVTNRCRVAVLLVRNNVSKDENCYSAYRVCVVDDSNAFQEWIEDENWKTLPKGILAFGDDQFFKTIITADASDIGGSASNKIPAIIFNDKGRLIDAVNNNPVISLRQGRYINNEKIFTEINGDGNVLNHTITITRFSGKTTIGLDETKNAEKTKQAEKALDDELKK